jgi:hypothetical protein
MNKMLLSTMLLTTLSASLYADTAPTAATTPPAAPAPTAAPATPTATTAPSTAPAPATTPSAPTQPLATPAPQQPVVINCKYHIPATTTTIDQNLISTWAGKAAVQSFNFSPASIDQELADLKFCYTDQGWQGFNEALQKSGNVAAIKSQLLTVSSMIDGDVRITPVKDNQWKANIPLQVVYQNDKEKLTQLLTIDLLIGRKVTGDLGIMQMIAIPRQTTTPVQATKQE